MPRTLYECLEGTRFGLVLSAGYFGFFGHVGFLKGLGEAGLVPSAFAGSSAGGLVCALAAAGLPLASLEQTVLGLSRESFWDPDPLGALRGALFGGFGATGLLKGDKFQALLRRKLPVSRMEDCPRPLTLVATGLTDGRAEVLTHGLLAPRVHASCAYPGLFRAVEVDGKLLWDGGLADKAPALALSNSPGGKGLEAILIHYLPSRMSNAAGGAWAYPRAMGAGIGALRNDNFKLQLAVLKARGLTTHVVESDLPAISPHTLSRGAEAMEAGRHSAVQALARAPRLFDGRDRI